jgi:hypothetical protein
MERNDVKITHYPKEGKIFMTGNCGANSISSTLDNNLVTCKKCLEIIKDEQIHKTKRP